MQFIKHFFFFLSAIVWSQSTIETNFIDKNSIQVSQYVSIDNFNQEYFIIDNELTLKARYGNLSYSNIQLGALSLVNVLNPLKINLFYRDLNTAVILDNRLAEITKVNFNQLQPQRIISHISTAHNNNIWLFNENTRQLELFDFISLKTNFTSLPISGKVTSLDSDYNTCWALTDEFIYSINYFGVVVRKIKNKGFTSLKQANGNLVLQKENSLYFLPKNKEAAIPIKLPELLINQFFVTNETLYIYDHEFLHRYQLITD
jgi:hypothetical protein